MHMDKKPVGAHPGPFPGGTGPIVSKADLVRELELIGRHELQELIVRLQGSNPAAWPESRVEASAAGSD